MKVDRGPIFTEVPSALDIMHWFLDKRLAGEWEGTGGDADYILSDRCFVDLLAHVDHDSRWFWLLSVGTNEDDGTKYGGATSYDLLFIYADLDGKRRCEWRNEPSEEQPWGHDGLVWFAGMIETYETEGVSGD